MSTKSRYPQWVVLLVLIAILPLSGCSSSEKTRGAVLSGTVNWEGSPLEEGTISFLDKATNEPATTGIKAGKYSLDLAPGEKKVSITAQKVTGSVPRDPRDPNSPVIETSVQYLPNKYNTRTTLTYTMTDATATENFDLTSE